MTGITAAPAIIELAGVEKTYRSAGGRGGRRGVGFRALSGVDGVYDTDPHLNPGAVRFTRLTYDEALAAGVRIMDTSAFVLANEQSLTMHVFDVAAAGVMREICEGAEHGTRISVK